MKRVKIIQERKSLSEGRNYGIGFAILKPLTKGNFETLNAFTACKDYLNDFSYVEYAKKEIGSVYGYNHKLYNCFDGKVRFFLGVNTLHKNGGGVWENFAECNKILIANYKALESFLNKIEDTIGIHRSSIEVDDDILIISAPIYWTKNGPLISVYTLLIRCFFNIDSKLLKTSDLLLAMKAHTPFIGDDKMMKASCIAFYEQVLKDKSVFKDFSYEKQGVTNAYGIHNFGIQKYMSVLPQTTKEINAI